MENDSITDPMVELRSLHRFDELRYAELFAIYLNREEAYVIEKNSLKMTLRKKKVKKAKLPQAS